MTDSQCVLGQISGTCSVMSLDGSILHYIILEQDFAPQGLPKMCFIFCCNCSRSWQPWIMQRILVCIVSLSGQTAVRWICLNQVCVFLHRLKLSPSPPSRVTVSRSVAASSSSSRSSRAKRKRVEAEEETPSTPSFHVSQQAEATGSISIKELDLEGKSVTLKNDSSKVWYYFFYSPFGKAVLSFSMLLYKSKAKSGWLESA